MCRLCLFKNRKILEILLSLSQQKKKKSPLDKLLVNRQGPSLSDPKKLYRLWRRLKESKERTLSPIPVFKMSISPNGEIKDMENRNENKQNLAFG